MTTSLTAPPGSAPAAAPGAPTAAPARRWRVDRLTVLNWLAFLAILCVPLGEGCAIWAARRREAREARAAEALRADDEARALRALEAARVGCDPAAWGLGLVTGAPAAADSVAAACAARARTPPPPPP